MYTSTWRYARISPRKARLLTDLIRGKSVQEALSVLSFSKKRAAIMVAKVLKTAIANADEGGADVADLYVSATYCDGGPIIKRFMPKDRGKSYAIMKRTSHITVTVDEGAAKVKEAKAGKKRSKAAKAA
jgi:large subunit ribosomal protein L22